MFYISAKPEGSLIRCKSDLYYVNVAEAGQQEILYKVTFMGKKSIASFVAMKRGYLEDTIRITRESSPKISFDLKKIDGTVDSNRYDDQLHDAFLYVLPPVVNAVLHKGAGAMDRYEPSEAISMEIRGSIMSQMEKEFCDTTKKCQMFFTDLLTASDTAKIPDQVIKYLISVKPELLKHYGTPPSVKRFYDPSKMQQNSSQKDKNVNINSFWAIVYCKTIKPTGGRIAGNMALLTSSGVVGGYQSAMYGTSTGYFNTDAFNIDSSTLITVYYIHPDSGEIVEIKQKRLPYDIVNDKNKITFVTELVNLLSDR
jgi:hypothetical protein